MFYHSKNHHSKNHISKCLSKRRAVIRSFGWQTTLDFQKVIVNNGYGYKELRKMDMGKEVTD